MAMGVGYAAAVWRPRRRCRPRARGRCGPPSMPARASSAWIWGPMSAAASAHRRILSQPTTFDGTGEPTRAASDRGWLGRAWGRSLAPGPWPSHASYAARTAASTACSIVHTAHRLPDLLSLWTAPGRSDRQVELHAARPFKDRED